MPDQDDVKSLALIPSWEQSDYLGTNEPYKWLYQLKDDPLKMQQMVERVATAAKESGVSNFKKLWEKYLKSVQKGRADLTSEVTDFTDQPLTLNCGGYSCSDDGITAWGVFGMVWVCTHPIMPVRRLINIDTGEVKLEIAFRRSKIWHKAIFDKATLSAASRITMLASYGIGVDSENAKSMVTYLSAMENMNYDALPEIKSVDRLGWMKGYGFSPYVENLLYDGDTSNKHMFDCVKASGSYETWLALAKKVRAGKSVVARVMLAASFASILIEPMEGLSFLVHVWGGSGAGKTVGLILAASVWAKPNMGDYCKSFNGTLVGTELLAAFCGNLPLCLDELQCIRGKQHNKFDDIIHMLSEGIGKNRGARSGGLQRTPTWRNCTISTGETPITTGSSGTGAVNRVVELDCRDEQLFENPREVVSILSQNYGHAGRRFVEMLSTEDCMDVAVDTHKAVLAQLLGKATDKQALSASIILAADALADLLIFEDGKALKPDDIISYLTTEVMADMNRRAYDWLVDTIASNPNKFEKGDYGYQGECWGMIDSSGIAFIIKGHFDKLLDEEGFNGESFLSWARRNTLIRFDGVRNTVVKRLPGINSVARCVALKLPNEDGSYPTMQNQMELPHTEPSDADESGTENVPVEFTPPEPEQPVAAAPVVQTEKTEDQLPF